MPSEVILPRVDMDMATGKISKWLIAGGAKVSKGQPLFEIETDKAAMEIEAPAAGTLHPLFDASGQDIPVGSTVAWIYADGEIPSGAPAAAGQPQAVQRDQARFGDEDRSFDSERPAESSDTTAPSSLVTSTIMVDRPRATPLARRLAREHGLDLGALNGSGPHGRIQASDVERRAAAAGAEAPSAPAPHDAGATLRSEAPLPLAGTAAAPAVRAASSSLNIVPLREGTGTPILLVHGWGADVNTWRPFLSAQRLGRPVYGIDLPGHGASPLGPIESFSDLVDVMEAGLSQAKLGPVDLVAHSLGAAAAAAAAARGMLDIRSLLLLSPAGLGPSINGGFLRGFAAARSEASLTPWMQELVVDPAHITPAFVRATLKARDGTRLAETLQRVADAVFPDGTQAFSIRGDLARLAVPTRVVFGTADRILPPAQTAGLPGLVALHLFPNVGHMPQFEAREAVATIIAQMAA